MLRGGIIGFGNVGQSLARIIHKDYQEVKIVAACNRGAEKLKIAREKYGLATTHDPAELVSMDLDFVCIFSTSHVHAEQVILAAEAGKHVFCEKPIALTIKNADSMVEAVEKAGVINVVNYSYRYNEAHKKLYEIVKNNKLGHILQMWHNHSRGYGLASSGTWHRAVQEPEESGGWIVHHMCHGIDTVYWMLGDFEDVYCQTRSTVKGKVSEEVCASLSNLKCGAQAVIMDTVSGYRFHTTGVIGEKGTVVIKGAGNETVMEMKKEGSTTIKRFAVKNQKRKGNGFDHFLECIRKNKRSGATIREARESLRIALAMRRSWLEKRLVKVNEN